MTRTNGTNGNVEFGSGDEVLPLASVLPRVLVVSRRTVRKNKFVDFVGEYHLDLVVSYGAVPVIVPRVSGLHSLLDSFEPIHGVLLCEGEDIDPSLYESDLSHLSPEEIAKIKKAHSSDTQIDKDKDSIELQLARRCLERNIPYLGICRGSQVLNVACGGSLYQDVETELSSKNGVEVHHINYDNYDGHRHPVNVIEGTPLHEWFAESLKKSSTGSELFVNSYHHQGVKRLATRFQPMAHAPDGLIEAFYDPAVCDPEEGKFIVGLQFHPERMRHEHDIPIESQTSEELMQESIFDYPECPRIYQEFVKAVVAYQKKLLSTGKEKINRKFDAAVMERQRMQIVRSFSLAKIIYEEEHLRSPHSVHGGQHALAALRHGAVPNQSEQELELGARFLQSNTALNSKQVKFLHEMGATVRNSSLFLEKMQLNERKEAEARKMMEGMQEQELQEFIDFYKMMVDAASTVLQQKRSFKRNF
ncbi:putative glutamine amidotransferase [Marchantia polymorpha subsp. ruderalis]|uniref:Glutamine amidotransferase domain-containing protein n=2 Tax=Marchantia polymorpha TaxID=3197 RepID=A0AAF6ALG9_MARPO|nr:hypothetical protein MARPO_0005s0158 [Marchantia polymorpha]BBM97289.1 hypothetical protein Mp_1g04490 [Marchantia polymorpha subsp. ruderalis]|eukprot:PTQ48518.1 hypothetical protein MARPO_0005s0158 [Marchantia polymorpha]